MAKASGTKEYRTFVKGLITEASAISFPEDASLDEANFILNRDGSRQRRLGLDYEDSYVLLDSGKGTIVFDNYNLTCHRWDNIGGDSTLAIGVVQIGNSLWFVDLYKSSLSGNLLNGGSAITLDGANGQNPYQMTNINGYLVVATGETDPFYLEYDENTDVVTKTDITLKVRDTFGIDDSLAIDTEPTTLSNQHEYNLLNQGWSSPNISAYYTAKSKYPSNAGISYLGRTASSAFDANEYERLKTYFGNTPAPKGKFIINAFGDRGADRTSQSGVTVYPDTESGKISTVVSQAGRIFYSGVNSELTGDDSRSPNSNGFVYYSRTVESPSHFSVCYQEADPTSEQISDLVDTDGGFINIPEANNIFKLVAVRDSVIVIAETGVWQISGNTDAAFTATGYKVNKITNIGAVNGETVIEAEGTVFYWSKGGIYVLTQDSVSGLLQAQNLSATTIQTFYNDIPSVSKANAIGNYDAASKTISWLYNDNDDYDGVILKNKYTKELIFDAVLQAFYPHTISSHTTNSPYIAAHMPTPNFLTVPNIQSVVVNGEIVQVNGENVQVTQNVRGRGTSVTKFLTFKYDTTSNTYKFTFSHYKDRRFVDWYTFDSAGKDYSSYLVTGYETHGDILRYKQTPYIVFFFKRTETGFIGAGTDLAPENPSSCLVQAQWNFADSANSGQWGTQFQAYRLRRNYIPDDAGDTFDYGYSTIVTKNKLRGKGRALSLKIQSETGKDMYLLGWATSITGGSAV